MKHNRVKIAKGVLWYPLSDDLRVVVSPSRRSREKCFLVKTDEISLFEKLAAPRGLSMDTLSDKEKDLVEGWLEPKGAAAIPVEELHPMASHEALALSVFREYASAKNLQGGHDLASYHQKEIQDPFLQFDEIETTVSHLYRDPHPALENKSYGGKFAHTLLKEKALAGGRRILEIGCGTGFFGREFLREIQRADPSLYGSLTYTFFDLSPVLSDSQRTLNREHETVVAFQTGNAYSDSLPERAFDLVICNEMIADLPVVKIKKDEEVEDGFESGARELGRRLGLDFSDAPPEFILNSGALQLLVTLSRTLKPGGRAFIVEYGSPHGYPVAYRITNHVEYSIHFGHLLTAARNLGMDADLTGLDAFLRFQGDVEVLDSPSHGALFHHLLPFLGIEADSSRVYTRDELAAALPRIIRKAAPLPFVP
ncbi:MAG: SAM-dependent methyltransferase, partial [Pseudomonadota bacterium]